ncbi:MAG: hypothetical protein CMJ72_10290 [Planctomycetaceae bacterium]|nr:hypothetical protein [Planctomycetaceae bacterium]
MIFETLDTNGDRIINSRELSKAISALKKPDQDKDGNLTYEEVTPQRGPGGGSRDSPQFVARIMELEQLSFVILTERSDLISSFGTGFAYPIS